jgi:hypothetical protein
MEEVDYGVARDSDGVNGSCFWNTLGKYYLFVIPQARSA